MAFEFCSSGLFYCIYFLSIEVMFDKYLGVRKDTRFPSSKDLPVSQANDQLSNSSECNAKIQVSVLAGDPGTVGFEFGLYVKV